MPQSAIKIIEVGPRDGLQNEPETIPTDIKTAFIAKLADAGLNHIEATAFVSPKWVPQMADSTEVLQSVQAKHTGVSFSVLVPNLKGLELAIASGAQRVAVVTAASETFNQKNINQSIEQAFQGIQAIIEKAQFAKISVRGYLSTCFVCPYEGRMAADHVAQLAKNLLDLGCDEVSLGDTTGAAGPRDIQHLLSALYGLGVSPEQLALHCHDTYGTALVNVYAGYQMGVRTFDSSAGGLGGCPYAPGASGNVATEDVVYMFESMGVSTGVDLEKLAAASALIQNYLGRKLPSKQLQRLLSSQAKSNCAL